MDADRGGGMVGFGRSYQCIMCQEYPEFMKTVCNDEYAELISAQTGTECDNYGFGIGIENPEFESGHGRVVIDLVCEARRRPSTFTPTELAPYYQWSPSGVEERRIDMSTDETMISSTVSQHSAAAPFL
eukprot:SAG31_NODE_6085_length_2178_cov_2.675325_3_plen_129_part_00